MALFRPKRDRKLMAIPLLTSSREGRWAMRNVDFSSVFGRTAVLAVLATVPPPPMAHAADTSPIFWMAASNSEPSFAGRSWGRLSLQDGALRFYSTDYEWRVALSDIKRVDQSKAAPRALEIETVAGAMHFVTILDARLLADSPRKAMQLIQRSMRDASTPRPTVLTKAPR